MPRYLHYIQIQKHSVSASPQTALFGITHLIVRVTSVSRPPLQNKSNSAPIPLNPQTPLNTNLPNCLMAVLLLKLAPVADGGFHRSQMEDVMQSTRIKSSKDSRSINLFDSEMSLTVMPGEFKTLTESHTFQSGLYVNPVAKSGKVWTSRTNIHPYFSLQTFLDCSYSGKMIPPRQLCPSECMGRPDRFSSQYPHT